MINQWLSGLEITYPYWLLILPIPLLLVFVPAYKTNQLAIKVPFFQQIVTATGDKPSEGASELKPQWWQRIILVVSWILVVCALTKPVVLDAPQIKESIGRDLMVAVDLSGSMQETDFTSEQGERVSRLDATKSVLESFISQREGDRVGLILFGDAAFLQAPFTADKEAWLALLNETQVGMAGQSTHLGDAIGLAITSFNDQLSLDNGLQDKERVVIVLTDGNDTGSFVDPIEAAKVAKAKQVRIHVIAIGDPTTVGETAIDLQVIDRFAQASGGQSFQALDRDQLAQVYRTIDELEPQLYESTTYYPKKSIHHYFIYTVLVLYILAFSIATFKRILQHNLFVKGET
ncbi:vWA domain-containing protein [Vibrio astriarenae]|uniref:vWA domain-containing protein n=1 Tax=Vibrio astriarenae TaxID=1481923 RepID=UPI003736C2AE